MLTIIIIVIIIPLIRCLKWFLASHPVPGPPRATGRAKIVVLKSSTNNIVTVLLVVDVYYE